ncbi:MAG TPA: NAD(P)H-dependent oxidoreductase [Actinomycetota bacterium]|nr:NAD(P)H-dependent oxidoreductase [Actinomycetota bacterium]
MTGSRLLVVHHTPSPAVRALLEQVVTGARLPELAEVEVAVEPALSATASDVLAARAVLLVTPANIGYMSGALKHFFDTIYYPCMDATRGLPYGLLVHGNDDTAGAVRSVQKIADALQWRQVAEVLSVVENPGPAQLQAAHDLGATVGVALLD